MGWEPHISQDQGQKTRAPAAPFRGLANSLLSHRGLHSFPPTGLLGTSPQLPKHRMGILQAIGGLDRDGFEAWVFSSNQSSETMVVAKLALCPVGIRVMGLIVPRRTTHGCRCCLGKLVSACRKEASEEELGRRVREPSSCLCPFSMHSQQTPRTSQCLVSAVPDHPSLQARVRESWMEA